MQLDQRDNLPSELMGLKPHQMTSLFPHPTLIHVRGHIEPPLFLSTLLHGNESTSFYVLQALAERYHDTPPPRSLLIFIGNVEAAAAGVRVLPNQPDFNRIWMGDSSPFGKLAAQVIDLARRVRPFASIDIHNNTGRNPLYGCVNILRPADLHLATDFSTTCVYYRNPKTTQSISFAHFCPAVTIECGQSGDAQGLQQAIALVDKTMQRTSFPDTLPVLPNLRMYETIGRVLIDPACSFSFGDQRTELVFRPDFGDLNFRELPTGEPWGTCSEPALPLSVLDEDGSDHASDFFRYEQGIVALKRSITPAMITLDRSVVRQDCLCYMMKRISVSDGDRL